MFKFLRVFFFLLLLLLLFSNTAELSRLSHVLSSHLQRFTLAVSGAYTESWPQGRVWGGLCEGEVCRAFGGACGPTVGIHRCCTPRGSWVGFLIWSTKLLVGIVSLWYILFWALAAVFPTSHCPSVMQFSTQYSGWGEKEVGLFGSIPHPGEARYSHTLTILHGRNHGPRSLCWHWAVIPWRKGDANKVKLLLLSSGMHAF